MCDSSKSPIKNIILKYKSKYLTFFPPNKNINTSKLQLTTIGEYSITHYEVSTEINNIIRDHMGDTTKLTITDATAGMGGNTIKFAEEFKHVNAVEYLSLHCQVLKNNIDVYNLKNVKIYCDDYTKIMRKIKQDVVFIDAPWGNRSYKKIDKLRLCLGKKSIEEITNKVNAKLVVLKVPHNFDFEECKKRVTDKIQIYNFKRFDLIVVQKKSK
jgi:16S rRNA G966 N2-methylase RsmD